MEVPVQQEPTQQTLYVENNQDHHHVYRMVIVTVAVLFLAVGSYFFAQRTIFNQNQTSNTNKSPQGAASIKVTENIVTPAPVFDENRPWIKLTPETEQTTYQQGQDIVILVKGFSNGSNIEGYDVLIDYNRDLVDLVSVQSIPTTFKTYEFRKNTHLTVTGVKQLDVTTPTAFNNDALIKIVVRGKKPGKALFTVLPSVKKEQTKFVDKNVNIIIPQLQSVQVEIK